MNSIKCFIIEDVPRDVEDLIKNLEDFPELEIVDSAEEVDEAVRKILEIEPDVLFWDYNIVGGTGFDVLERLEKLGAQLPLCVAISAFKGFNHDRFAKYMNLFVELYTKSALYDGEFKNKIRSLILKLRERLGTQTSYIHHPASGFFFIDTGSIHRIDLSAIVKIESHEKRLVQIYTSDGKKSTADISLTKFLRRLNCSGIIKISNLCAINLQYISKYSRGELQMKHFDKPLTVTETFKTPFEKALNTIN
jgi:two-component system, LytTR family, response regulator